MAAAAVTVPNDITLTVQVAKGDVSYATVENALLAGGFTDFVINRQAYDTFTSLTITVFPPKSPILGTPIPFPAKDTLAKLSVAAGKFGD